MVKHMYQVCSQNIHLSKDEQFKLNDQGELDFNLNLKVDSNMPNLPLADAPRIELLLYHVLMVLMGKMQSAEDLMELNVGISFEQCEATEET